MPKLIANTTPIRTFEAVGWSTKTAVAVFPNKRRMVTGSEDHTLRLWDLETGVVLKKMEGHGGRVLALVVSQDGQIIASGDFNGEIIAWHGETGESLTQPIKAHHKYIFSVDFSPDGAVLATGGSDEMTKFWCTKTWQMQGEPIKCGDYVNCVRYSPSGELLAIGTHSNIKIYNPGTRERVASFGDNSLSIAWTPNGTRLLSGSKPNIIQEWDALTWEQVGHPWEGHTGTINAIAIHPSGTLVASASRDNNVRLWRLSDQRTVAIFKHSSSVQFVTFSADGKHIFSGGKDRKTSAWQTPKRAYLTQILDVTTARNACIAGGLDTAQELLTQEIHTNANDHTSYAHRSFVMAQKHAWDLALDDAIKSIAIQRSLIGYISKGIALCGKGHIREARIAFDVASMFTNKDSESNHFLILIKAIALFSADQHEEAMMLIKELAAACPNIDPLACRVVETHLRVQLGIEALDGARHDEAADYFTVAVNSGAFSSKYIHEVYEELTMLFGWDLESLCLTTHQKRCQAFLSAGKPDEALEAHQYMMDAIDECTKASCLDWSNEFKGKCNALAEQNDRILGAEIPGQEQDGYDTEPNFFHGMPQHSQISRPRPQRRHGRLKRLKLAMTKTPRSAPLLPSAPAPAPAPTPTPITPPSTVAPTTLTALLGNLFPWRSDNTTSPVVDVPFAKGKERNAHADAPGRDPDIVPYEDQDLDTTQPDPNTQQQQQPVAVQVDTGEHGRGRLCCCC